MQHFTWELSLHVSRENIANGIIDDCYACPLANSIGEYCGENFSFSVGWRQARISLRKAHTHTIWDIDKNTRHFIKRVDGGQVTKPRRAYLFLT